MHLWWDAPIMLWDIPTLTSPCLLCWGTFTSLLICGLGVPPSSVKALPCAQRGCPLPCGGLRGLTHLFCEGVFPGEGGNAGELSGERPIIPGEGLLPLGKSMPTCSEARCAQKPCRINPLYCRKIPSCSLNVAPPWSFSHLLWGNQSIPLG